MLGQCVTPAPGAPLSSSAKLQLIAVYLEGERNEVLLALDTAAAICFLKLARFCAS